MRANINDMVHFSIDDVSGCFRWIHENQPESIFEEPMLARLHRWYRRYGLEVDCYVFEEVEGFNLKDLEDKYWAELSSNANWLRLGWHQIRPNIETYDIDSQIASAQRVSKLIIENCSLFGLSRALRLHMFAGDSRLVESLRELGINIFLTADSKGRSSYDLTEEESDLLWREGIYYCQDKKLLYKRTDLRMDLLSDGCTVTELMGRAYDIVNLYPSKRSIEIFCHEWKFSEVSEGIEQFLLTIGSVGKRIYLNAAVINGKEIYFTDACSSVLYKLDMVSKKISNLTTLPRTDDGSKYASLHLYEKKLWMVPWNAGKLLVYDLCEKKITEIFIEGHNKSAQLKFKCRKSIKYKKYLWLLPYDPIVLVRIDMDNYQAELIDRFPDGVSFDTDKAMPFKCMDIFDDELYLFSDSCSYNLKVNANTGEIKIWNNDFNGTFGVVLDHKRILLPPVREGIPLKIYHDDTSTFTEVTVPDWMWRKTEFYAFWYACRTKNYIYIMPHEANGIIRYSMLDDRFDFIKPPEINYYSLRPNPGFSGYETLENLDGTWLVPYAGNQILCIGKDASISDVYNLEVSLAQFYENMWIDWPPVCESIQPNLNDLMEEVKHIAYVKCVMGKQESMPSTKGKDIYQKVMTPADIMDS